MHNPSTDRDLRWVVDKPGLNLLLVLEQMGAQSEAIADGRVFVQRRRIALYEQDRKLEVGDEVQVYGERKPGVFEILSEHNGVLAVNKPAGISTQPDHRGSSHSLLGELAALLGQPLTTLHALQRLDREVSGVLLVARHEEGRRWVLQARAQGAFKRRYVAIANGSVVDSKGEWAGPIGRGRRPGLRVLGGREPDAALTRYEFVTSLKGNYSVLVAEPVTGRTHQIRVHAAGAGVPLLGDGDYGGLRRATLPSGAVRDLPRIALHALCSEVAQPGAKPWCNEAPMPQELLDLWQWLGGALSDFAGLAARAWL